MCRPQKTSWRGDLEVTQAWGSGEAGARDVDLGVEVGTEVLVWTGSREDSRPLLSWACLAREKMGTCF